MMRTVTLFIMGIVLCLLSAALIVFNDYLAGCHLEAAAFQTPVDCHVYLLARASSLAKTLATTAALLLPGAFSLILVPKNHRALILAALALLALADGLPLLLAAGPSPLPLFLAHLSFSLMSNLLGLLSQVLRDATPNGNMAINPSRRSTPCPRFPLNSAPSPPSSPPSPSAC